MKQTTKNYIVIGSAHYTGVYSPDSQMLVKNVNSVLNYSVDNGTNWLPCVSLTNYPTLNGSNSFTGPHNYFVRVSLSEGANTDWVSVNSLEINTAEYIRSDTLVPYFPVATQTDEASTLGTALLPWLTTFTTNINNGTSNIAVSNIPDKTANNVFTGTNSFETIVPTYINMDGQSGGMRTPQILRTTGTQDSPWVAVDTLVPYTSGLTLGNASESWQSVYTTYLVSGTTTIPVADINKASGLYLDLSSSISIGLEQGSTFTLTSTQASSIYSAYTGGKLGIIVSGTIQGDNSRLIRIDFNCGGASAAKGQWLNFNDVQQGLITVLLSTTSSAGTLYTGCAQI